MTWWKENPRFSNGHLVSVGFIQFDLSGHSVWAATNESEGQRYQVYQSRAQLQGEVRRAVAGYDFSMHHWAGDGGLFAGLVESSDQADAMYRAMSQMFAAFVAWRGEAPLRSSLRCRISGTIIPDLCIDAEPGNWYSPDLNWFLKYERQIGLEGTIRVTKSLRNLLDKYAVHFPIPASKRLVALPDGSTVLMFQDAAHVPTHKDTDRSFREWLNKNRAGIVVPVPTVPLANLPENAFQFGDAVILNTALGEAGYRELYLEPRAAMQVRRTTFQSDVDTQEWLSRVKELVGAGVVGTRCRVHTLKPELLDDPAIRLEWSLGTYADANAFSGFASQDPKRAQRYSASALRVLQDGTEIPNTLSNHSVVITGEGTERMLLLAHRRKGTRPGTYSRNCWSVSFEEQFIPAKETIAGRSSEVDSTIDGCVLRGLREEFLGFDYAGPMQVSIHAFQLEAWCINFGFVALVRLPTASFAEILALWPTAPDTTEHDALAALPLSEELVRECLAAERLPPQLFHVLGKSAGFDALEGLDHAWHPTSTLRLVLSLWQAQQMT